jgi:predicted DNA-binding protein
MEELSPGVVDELVASDDLEALTRRSTEPLKTSPTKPGKKLATTSSDPRVRVTVRVAPDLSQRVSYWADKAGISTNEYVIEAIESAIRRENADYDLPTLEIARLEQLKDVVASLSSDVQNLTAMTQTGFDSLAGLTRGDNYLMDDEDGELGGVSI